MAADDLLFAPARLLGDTWALDAPWRELGLDRLDELFRRGASRRTVPTKYVLRPLVFNRLCDSRIEARRASLA